MSASNPTKAELAALLAQATAALAVAQGQHATPTAVAEVVAEPVKPVTASDQLKAHVESKGLLFARGGRTTLTLATLQEAVKVLKSGEPTVLSLAGVGTYAKRGVTGIAIGRADDGKSVITQFVYDPTATKN